MANGPDNEGVRLESARLRLRPISAANTDDYFALHRDARAMAYLGGPWTRETCVVRAQQNEERWAKYGFASWMVDLVEGDNVERNVALIGFSGPREDDSVSFGWIVAPQHWRQGITTESSILALDWFFEHFEHRVLTETTPQNVASQEASRALGFNFLDSDDKRYVCEITREQWRSKKRIHRTGA